MEKDSNSSLKMSVIVSSIIIMMIISGIVMIYFFHKALHASNNVDMAMYYIVIIFIFLLFVIAYFYLASLGTQDNHLKIYEVIANKLGETYKEKEFEDEDKMAMAREDLEAFKAYDDALINNRDELSEYDSVLERKVYEYTHKIGDKDTIIDLFAPKDSVSYIESSRNTIIDVYEYGIMFKTSKYDSRLVLSNEEVEVYPDSLFASPKKESFDDAFVLLTEGVKEFDKEHVDYYKSDIFNRKYENREQFLNGNYKFIELDPIKKKMLFDIYKENCDMIIILEGGIGRCYINYYKSPDAKIKDPEEIGNIIAEQFKRIISEFSY